MPQSQAGKLHSRLDYSVFTPAQSHRGVHTDRTRTVQSTDSLWSFMHSDSFLFLPRKKKRIRTETEKTFTVVCSYNTSLPVKKLDKDLLKKLIFQKEIRQGTEHRHRPWGTAEIVQNLAASPAMMVSPNHPGTARRKPTDVKARTEPSVIAAARDKRRGTTLTADLIIR